MQKHQSIRPDDANTGASLHDHRVLARAGRRARSGHGAAATDDFVLVTMRGIRDAAALEQYVRDRTDKLCATAPHVLWYEVAVQRHRSHRPGCAFAARVTAHLPDRHLAAQRNDDDEFLAVRDVFDELGDQLRGTELE